MTAVISTCALAIGALLAVGWVVATADSGPNLDQLKARSPNPPSEVFAANGTLLGYIHSNTISISEAGDKIPNTLKEATVAIEDRRFWHHGALDYQGILRAGVRDLLDGGSALQGASTLTMQLVDNRYMPASIAADHNLKYKIIQAKLAEQLEQRHSKMWILDTYLNDVPYGTVGGQTALGVGAASAVFFDKPVDQLDLAQEALLAGLPQAPSEYNPFIAPQLARQRRDQVLQAMVQSHYITQAQAAAANREPLQVHPNTTYTQVKQPYIFNYIEQQLIDRFGANTVENGGLKVYSTINLQMQQEAENAIHSYEGGPVLDNQPAAALATVDPANGNILAIASSASYNQTNFDYPVQAERQTGSAFKVFALMTLIKDYHGDPDQTYYDSKFLPAGWLPQDPTWSVHTAEDSYQGVINITKATILSDNTVYAQLAADLGWHKLDQTAHAMGITSELTGNPAEVIGGLKDCCTMLEMADAYATLANGGSHVPPTILTKVVFPHGKVVNLGNPPHTQVFSYPEAYEGTSILKQVITSPDGTGTAANYGCPAAGKTGTANNLDNAWFVGYTRKLSTAVWVGYPQGNIPMANGFGGALAAPIWRDFMEQASNGYCGDWTAPAVSFQGTAFVGPHSASRPVVPRVSAYSPQNAPTYTPPPQAPPVTPQNSGGAAGGVGPTVVQGGGGQQRGSGPGGGGQQPGGGPGGGGQQPGNAPGHGGAPGHHGGGHG